jgi:hypothetical protein
LVRTAGARLHHALVVLDARLSPDERRELEQVARDLRYAIRYLGRQRSAPSSRRSRP